MLQYNHKSKKPYLKFSELPDSPPAFSLSCVLHYEILTKNMQWFKTNSAWFITQIIIATKLNFSVKYLSPKWNEI